MTVIYDGTIAAISSAVGPAARMIVRVSGRDALRIAADIAPGANLTAGVASRGVLQFSGLTLPGWVYAFRSPRSYSGEDLIEFHVPGNPVLARMLLDAVVSAGARHAEPGEFTARAYFNGRLDLTEAEGVAATISANSEQELSAARRLLSGELARRLAPAMDQIAQTLALVEVGIDFSDEDVTFLSAEQVLSNIAAADRVLSELIDQSARFEQLSHEPQFVLVGRPNAGKSTLLNVLAGHERAVTSPVAGTTRDVLTAEVPLRRGIVRLTDVAGIDPADRLPSHTAESPLLEIQWQMQQQAQRALESADHVLLVQDSTDRRPRLQLARTPRLVVLTKSDLASQGPAREERVIRVSAVTGENLPRLKEVLDQHAFGASAGSSTLALNARHLHQIEEARTALQRAAQQARDAAGAEVVALDLREGLDALGIILGRISPDDLLGRIFSKFCIGK